MKALITIIILALIGWAIWWFVGDRGTDIDVENTPAAVEYSLTGEDNDDSATSTDDDNLEEFEDKG